MAWNEGSALFPKSEGEIEFFFRNAMKNVSIISTNFDK